MFEPNLQQPANEEVKAEGQEIATIEQDAQETALESEEKEG